MGDHHPDETSHRVRGARIGVDADLTWIVERFSPLLRLQAEHRLPRHLLHDCDPDDLVQEVWAVTLSRFADLESRSGRLTPVLLRFMSSTLLNRINNLLTQQATQRRERTGTESQRSDPSPLDRQSVSVSATVKAASRNEIAELIRKAIDRLEAKDREILVLRGIEQLSNQQVSRLLNLQPSAVSMRYRRALDTLRGLLPGSVSEGLLPD